MNDFPRAYLQPLRMTPGWKVISNGFRVLVPNELAEDDRRWDLFEHDLLSEKHEQQDVYLELGWRDMYDPKGHYLLWLTKHNREIESELTLCDNTRNKNEVIEALETWMMKISKEAGWQPLEFNNIRLQPVAVTGGWKVVEHKLFELEPTPDLKVEGMTDEEVWSLFGSHLFQIQSGWIKLDISWEPAHDPFGRFVVREVEHENWEKPLKRFETKSNREAADMVYKILIRELRK